MNEKMLLDQMRFWRQRTLASIKATQEEKADIVPEGFNNSIRWNFGHVLFSQESLIQLSTGRSNTLPDEYVSLFAGGTKPSEWESEPPTLEMLFNQLNKQTDALLEFLNGKTHEEMPEPFDFGPLLKMTTVGEVVTFTIQHELLHNGFIDGLKRALKIKELRVALD